MKGRLFQSGGDSLVEENVSMKNPPIPFILRSQSKKQGTLVPMPGKKFTPKDLSALQEWVLSKGSDVKSADVEGFQRTDNEGGSLRVVLRTGDITEMFPRLPTKKESKAASEAQSRKETEKKKEQSDKDTISSSPSTKWVVKVFGDDFANDSNFASLLRYLDGEDDTFGGLISRFWMDGLLALGATEDQLRGMSQKEILSFIKKQHSAKMSASVFTRSSVIAHLLAAANTLEESSVDRSTDDTVVEYAMRLVFKGKSPSAAAKATSKKLSGGTNIFLGGGVTTVNPESLEAAIWDRFVPTAKKALTQGSSLEEAADSALQSIIGGGWSDADVARRTKLVPGLVSHLKSRRISGAISAAMWKRTTEGHYSDDVVSALMKLKWKVVPHRPNQMAQLEKTFTRDDPGDSFTPERVVTLSVDDTGRWFTLQFGWGDATDFDGRTFAQDPVAGAKKVDVEARKLANSTSVRASSDTPNGIFNLSPDFENAPANAKALTDKAVALAKKAEGGDPAAIRAAAQAHRAAMNAYPPGDEKKWHREWTIHFNRQVK